MAVTTSWISKEPGRCGSEACLRDTRITVWGLMVYRRLGLSHNQIIETVRGLTAADLQIAWEYAASHVDEIESAIRENEEGKEGFLN